jgi:surface polysaccharide O-acyltransferase-like enzyme
MIQRDGNLDTLRGIMMLYVVAVIHGMYWLNSVPSNLDSLLLFEMPIIFFISGCSFYYQINLAKFKEPVGFGEFYYKFISGRTKKLLVPYLGYALCCIALVWFGSKDIDRNEVSFFTVAVAWLNPFQIGANYSIGMLNGHLWFLPIFLAVCLLLPVVAKLPSFSNKAILFAIFVASVLHFYLSKYVASSAPFFTTVFFYLIFTVYGYYFKKNSINKHALIFTAAILCLVIIYFTEHDKNTFNMQKNKFPPNYIFLLYSFACLSASIFFGKMTRLSTNLLEWLGNRVYIKPFINSGYEIYLWQGLGYSIAIKLGKTYLYPKYVIWVLAIISSIFFGVLAALIEKRIVRMRRLW